MRYTVNVDSGHAPQTILGLLVGPTMVSSDFNQDSRPIAMTPVTMSDRVVCTEAAVAHSLSCTGLLPTVAEFRICALNDSHSDPKLRQPMPMAGMNPGRSALTSVWDCSRGTV